MPRTASPLRWVPFLAVAALVGQACNCDPDLVDVPGNINGRVCHPDSGDGLAGAALVLTGRANRNSIAAGDGSYAFALIPPGKYTLTATLNEVVRSFDVQVKSSESTTVTDSACRPDPGNGDVGDLSGQICNRHTGTLVTDAQVVLQLGNGDVLATQTDDTGSFNLPQVPAGEHIVSISGVGFQRAFRVDIPKGGEYRLDLAEDCEEVLATEGGIVGSFCDPDNGGNLVGASVSVQPAAGGEVVEDITDTTGGFEVNGLAPGIYRVDVTNGVFAFTDPQVEVQVGQLTVVQDQSRCGSRAEVGRIEGQICDERAGGRFAGSVELLQGATVVASTTSSSDGRFSFNAIPPGTYTVRAFYADGSYEREFPGVVVTPFDTAFVQEANCPSPQDVCNELINNPSETADGRILLIVDRSGSMSLDDRNGQQKWGVMKAALENVTQALTSTVEFGLMLFPAVGSNDDCAVGTLVQPMAFNNAAAIQTRLEGAAPEGNTPTAVTLNQSLGVLQPLVGDGRPLAVLLATDGGPNCNGTLDRGTCRCTNPGSPCDSDIHCLDSVDTLNAVGEIRNLGVQTYVIGVSGVENFADVLNQAADIGGTALPVATGPRYYEANDQAALQAALEAITQRVLTCRVETGVDLTTVSSVTVRVGAQVLSRDTSRTNGWDMTSNSVIELFGSACDAATNTANPVVVQTCVSP